MNLTKQFFKYVSQNIFGLLGTSCYILADTYFISQAAGTDGVTLLNLCLPIYNFIFAIGSMIGLGAATRYAILRAQGEERAAKRYFSNAVFCACALIVPFRLVCIFSPGGLLRLMGGDAGIMALGIPYARIFLMFTPFFMCNYIVSAFVRNDGDPSLAMVATLSSSLFNVVFDYIFMFPMGLGLAGAALATAVSPIISISICSRHFFKKENSVQFVRQRPSARLLGQSCQLGISGFVGEMSSGVTTTVFNFLLLGLAGNVAVAAYGVVANFALVATAIFNGVAQGAQPLVSECYGKSDKAGARKLLILGSCTALVLAAVLYGIIFGATDALVGVFNSESSARMAQFAHMGMRLYFVGYFFAGFNIVAAGYLSATDRPAEASITSICRGMAAIVVCSLVLSRLFGMNGVWAAFHAPKKLVIPMAVMLRYIPTIQEDWRYIKDAMRMRDVSPSLASFLAHPGMTVECIYVPLLMAASKAADDLSVASVTRGIENPNPRTGLVQIKCGAADWGVMAVAVAYLIFELCVRGGVIG